MAETFLLVDTSNSMADPAPQEPAATRMDILKRTLSTILPDGATPWPVTLFAFSDRLTKLGSFGRDSEVGRVLNAIPALTGGTHLWDAIGEVLAQARKRRDVRVICITDGEDQGSALDQAQVQAMADHTPGLTLQVIRITDSPASTPESGIDQDVGSAEELDSALRTALKATPRAITPGIPSMPVVSLVPSCTDRDVATVAAAVRAAVAYLEGLTGLRYYPVPTLIVDEDTRLELGGAVHVPPMDDVLRDVREMLRFLNGL